MNNPVYYDAQTYERQIYTDHIVLFCGSKKVGASIAVLGGLRCVFFNVFWSGYLVPSFRRRLNLDTVVKLLKVSISFVIPVCLSVRPHGSIGQPLDRFPLFFIFFEIMSRKKFN